MNIHETMNPENPVCKYDVECISFFYKMALKTATVSNLDEVRECMEWTTSVQSQIIGLIKTLSIDESILRDLEASDDSGSIELVESDYNRQINFLSEVGEAVSEMSDRLRAARHYMRAEQYKAAQRAETNAPA